MAAQTGNFLPKLPISEGVLGQVSLTVPSVVVPRVGAVQQVGVGFSAGVTTTPSTPKATTWPKVP